MNRCRAFSHPSGDGFLTATELAVAALDAAGTVSAWSRGAQMLLGYAPDEIVGHAANRLLMSSQLSEAARRHLADHVATWKVAADPAAVADARRWTVAQLLRWGLAEAVPTTELIVSELVTNAIRHATAPITLRLIHNGMLICEVSDASRTSPHPRRARVLDEGGRGLLLVALLCERWGTRHTGAGKTIWAEQPHPLHTLDPATIPSVTA